MVDLSLKIDCYSDRYDEVGIGTRDTVERDEPFPPNEQWSAQCRVVGLEGL
jgi:hypothetical protein